MRTASAGSSGLIGTSFGHYAITAKLGEGGMGEVWRARDEQLGRDVALKLLPSRFANDPEWLARFQREARLLAQLNHSNIAQIYGLESSGGARALVMELVDGPTLAERLEAGPLALDESLSIALQIARALEEAHESGIVHRDLKPQNVKVGEDGGVKVLDFGLAKAVTEGSAQTTAELVAAPTAKLTGTAPGMILGTAAYMSPEQARGRALDARTDVWSFGVVLYELLAGRRLFAAPSVAETLAEVLTRDIDFATLPPETPPELVRLVRRCLAREPRRRLHAIADARLALEELASGERDTAAVTSAVAASGWRRALPWAVATAGVAAALASGLYPRSSGPVAVARRAVEVSLPADLALAPLSPPAISPDGRWIAYAAARGDEPVRLWLRPIEAFAADVVLDTEGAYSPFWAPDSRQVGYFAGGDLRRIDLETRAPRTVCGGVSWARGGAWTADGAILFAPSPNGGIFSVPAAGGAATALTTPDASLPDASHRFPALLPDRSRFLFTVWSNSAEAMALSGGVYVGSRAGEAPRRLLADASSALFVAPGAVVVHREGRLVAYDLDGERLEAGTTPATVADSVNFVAASGLLEASASQQGDLLFAPGGSGLESELELVWLDRAGAATTALERRLAITTELELAPGGKRFVAAAPAARGGFDDLWVGEPARGAVKRVTRGAAEVISPRWAPDGRRIAFSSSESGDEDVYLLLADGTGVPRRLFHADGSDVHAYDWSPDGRELLAGVIGKGRRGRWELHALDAAGGGSRRLLADAGLDYLDARLSPDGRWVALVVAEGGSTETHVRPYPALDRDWQISIEGGDEPHWRADGREIVFHRGSTVFAVAVAPVDGDLAPSAPEPLFTAKRRLRAMAPAPEHDRFLAAVLPPEFREPPLRLLLGGWASLDPGGG